MTRLKLILGIVFVAFPTLSNAAAPLGVNCSVSADKSSIVVHAFNSTATAYQCTIWCKATVMGQAAFTPVTCSLQLDPNMPDKIVCDQKAPGSGEFSGIATHQMTCVPR